MITLVTSYLATLAFGVLLHAPGRALHWAALLGSAAQGCFWGLQQAGLSDPFAIFLASVVASLLAEICARRMKMAVTVFVTLSIIPLVPGLALYRAMASLAQGASQTGADMGVSAMITFLMIALGVGMGSFIARLRRGFAPSPPKNL